MSDGRVHYVPRSSLDPWAPVCGARGLQVTCVTPYDDKVICGDCWRRIRELGLTPPTYAETEKRRLEQERKGIWW